jgi:glycosyltransferase involved in cell wall biosynthesis
MRRAQVLVIFSSGEIGGAERSLTRMVLAARGGPVDYQVATCGEGAAWQRWADEIGLAPLSFPIFAAGALRWSEIARLVRHCRASPPDAIYAVGIRCAALMRILRPLLPRIALVHGIRSTFPRGTALASRMRLSERLLGWLTDHYVANSQAGADSLARIAGTPAGKITVIHNGVEPSAVALPDIRARARRIAVVANLNRYKGHLEFLDIVEQLRAAIADVEVLFVGRDDSGGEVPREVERRGLSGVVRISGFQSTPDLLVATARVFALPSTRIEGCPTAVIEALMLGIPVVAYQIGGLPEIVQSGVTGALAPPGRADLFAAALLQLLQDEDLNARYSAAARAEATARFTLAECAARHSTLFSRLTHPEERS